MLEEHGQALQSFCGTYTVCTVFSHPSHCLFGMSEHVLYVQNILFRLFLTYLLRKVYFHIFFLLFLFLSGVIFLNGESFYIEPLQESEQEHLIYRAENVLRDKPLYSKFSLTPLKSQWVFADKFRKTKFSKQIQCFLF